jgi:hypothetical protein
LLFLRLMWIAFLSNGPFGFDREALPFAANRASPNCPFGHCLRSGLSVNCVFLRLLWTDCLSVNCPFVLLFGFEREAFPFASPNCPLRSI